MTTAISILDEMIATMIEKAEEHKNRRSLQDANMVLGTIHVIREAKSRIQALGGGWIPVSERLPDIPDEHYLICVKNKNKEDGIYIIDFAVFSEGIFHKQNTWEDIIFWMPLPLPPTK